MTSFTRSSAGSPERFIGPLSDHQLANSGGYKAIRTQRQSKMARSPYRPATVRNQSQTNNDIHVEQQSPNKKIPVRAARSYPKKPSKTPLPPDDSADLHSERTSVSSGTGFEHKQPIAQKSSKGNESKGKLWRTAKGEGGGVKSGQGGGHDDWTGKDQVGDILYTRKSVRRPIHQQQHHKPSLERTTTKAPAQHGLTKEKEDELDAHDHATLDGARPHEEDRAEEEEKEEEEEEEEEEKNSTTEAHQREADDSSAGADDGDSDGDGDEDAASFDQQYSRGPDTTATKELQSCWSKLQQLDPIFDSEEIDTLRAVEPYLYGLANPRSLMTYNRNSEIEFCHALQMTRHMMHELNPTKRIVIHQRGFRNVVWNILTWSEKQIMRCGLEDITSYQMDPLTKRVTVQTGWTSTVSSIFRRIEIIMTRIFYILSAHKNQTYLRITCK
jgi:hypothetical protein